MTDRGLFAGAFIIGAAALLIAGHWVWGILFLLAAILTPLF